MKIRGRLVMYRTEKPDFLCQGGIRNHLLNHTRFMPPEHNSRGKAVHYSAFRLSARIWNRKEFQNT